jgi:hypothetical protein
MNFEIKFFVILILIILTNYLLFENCKNGNIKFKKYDILNNNKLNNGINGIIFMIKIYLINLIFVLPLFILSENYRDNKIRLYKK